MVNNCILYREKNKNKEVETDSSNFCKKNVYLLFSNLFFNKQKKVSRIFSMITPNLHDKLPLIAR